MKFTDMLNIAVVEEKKELPSYTERIKRKHSFQEEDEPTHQGDCLCHICSFINSDDKELVEPDPFDLTIRIKWRKVQTSSGKIKRVFTRVN